MGDAERQFKDSLYEQFARIGKALSSPKRLELLDVLCQGGRSIEALVRETGLSVANASQHLQVLRSARLVEAQKDGQYVICQISGEEVCQFFRAFTQLAARQLAEVEQLMRTQDAAGAGAPDHDEVLVDRIRKGAVTVVDVRPVEEYRAGHIPGAVSVPVADLEDRLTELPQDREVVIFCRGPYCVFASQAINHLSREGLRPIRMRDSIVEWRERGFPVATGDSP